MDALQPVGGPIPPVPVPIRPVFVPMDGQEAVTHMLTVCGVTLTQHNAVTNVKGIQDIAALAAIYLGDVKQMTENLSRLALGRGGAYIGTSATAKIKALIWWVQDAHAQGNVVDPNDWNTDILDDAQKRMLLEKLGRDKVNDIVEAPKRLDPSKWVDLYLTFINFLRGQTSANGKRTLDYVVRKYPHPAPHTRWGHLGAKVPHLGTSQVCYLLFSPFWDGFTHLKTQVGGTSICNYS
jgi:hypothetical protein